MLQSMKNKASELDGKARDGTTAAATTNESEISSSDDSETDQVATTTTTDDENAEGSKYTAIVAALQALKPSSLTVVDNSQQNGAADGKETHFELNIVASAFEGLNVIKRQQLVFMILGDLMPQIESLQIASMFTPEEVEQRA